LIRSEVHQILFFYAPALQPSRYANHATSLCCEVLSVGKVFRRYRNSGKVHTCLFFCGLFRMLAVTHTVVLNGMMTGVLDRIWLEAATVFVRMDRYTAVFLIPY